MKSAENIFGMDSAAALGKSPALVLPGNCFENVLTSREPVAKLPSFVTSH